MESTVYCTAIWYGSITRDLREDRRAAIRALLGVFVAVVFRDERAGFIPGWMDGWMDGYLARI